MGGIAPLEMSLTGTKRLDFQATSELGDSAAL
jgi:hypothetical protein